MKGLNFWKTETASYTALYADDLTLFLKDEQNMQQALEILAEFSRNERPCGSVVNKTALTLFGDLCGRGDSKFLVCILPVINVLLKLKRTRQEGWKTLKG